MCADFNTRTSEKREEILLHSKKPLTSINMNKIDMDIYPKHPRVKLVCKNSTSRKNSRATYSKKKEFLPLSRRLERIQRKSKIVTSATGMAQNLDTDGVKLKKNSKRNTKITILEDFLIPALNDNRYGDILKWTEKTKGEFTMKWSHGNSHKWETTDCIVFQDWDKLKKKYTPDEPGYYNTAKQRFRCALNSKNIIRVNFHKGKENETFQKFKIDPNELERIRKPSHWIKKGGIHLQYSDPLTGRIHLQYCWYAAGCFCNKK
ncbi:IRF tryptophan pentad repeat domain-containing protein [Caerostris darwini]|uniref:IRF tryptophan pentad repeat domain-containing protein n=1 Tax=Caerostris darwini TaxID=1538125 RepID=A0AAV4WD10_9ARAC|nr:IRF tryptophan pentad repeat domain-containing protein [Caerostris darwini]